MTYQILLPFNQSKKSWNIVIVFYNNAIVFEFDFIDTEPVTIVFRKELLDALETWLG